MSRRPARRLLVAALALLALDPFVPRLVRRLEVERYEHGEVVRFENSDLFSIGPLAAYLREHPRGPRPRVAFFGNSFVWGYFLSPGDAVPAQFQRLVPETRVLNLAVNGFETPSGYLMAKDIIEAIDVIYLFPVGTRAHPLLPRLIRVDDADARRFSLTPRDPLDARLAGLLDVWSLYRNAHRLQAALFGTSARQYLYVHKASLPSAVWASVRGGGTPPPTPSEPTTPTTEDGGVIIEGGASTGPVAEARRRELATAHPLLWDFAKLVRSHGKQAVVVDVRGMTLNPDRRDRLDLNAIFQPHVVFLTMAVPEALKFDRIHLSETGARAVARALRRHAPAPLSSP